MIRRFIGEEEEKTYYEQSTRSTYQIYGRTGPDGSHYLRYGIYPAGIFSDHGTFHHIPDRTGSCRSHYLRTKGRINLWTCIWNHQLYAVFWNGCIWNDAVFHQPAGNCICVYRTKTSGRTALWSDFSGIEKIYEKRSLSGGKSFLPASEYSVFYDQSGSSIL